MTATLVQLVPLALKISISLVVIGLALSATPGDLVYLLRRPSLLVRSLFAMNIVMPFLAAVIAGAFQLRPELELTLILLAVSPVPPALPNKQGKAGGNISYAMGLVVVSALAAIVLVPALVTVIGRVFGRAVHVPMAAIAGVVLPSVVAPLLAGALVRRVAPSLAARWAGPIAKAGTLLLPLAFVPILLGSWRGLMGAVGDFTLFAIVLFVLTSLVVGHLFGGPDPDDRTVLALSTARRHPAVAMAVAGAVLADKQAVSPTLLLAVLVGSIVVAPYTVWRRRGSAGPTDLAGLKAFARRYTDAWNSQRPENVAAHFAERGTLSVNADPPALGRPAIAEVARGFMTAFPDMVVTMDDLVPGPKGIRYHWTLTGTNTGPGGTGKRVRISGHEEWKIGTDGLIADSQGHFDRAEYARQLEFGA